MRNVKILLWKITWTVASPFTLLAARWMRYTRKKGPNSKLNDKIFMRTGMLPVLDHYYQPLINPKKALVKSLREDRSLPGIDWNTEEQLELLTKFNFNNELLQFPVNKGVGGQFFYNNGSYCSGDAEYLYNIVRHFKPKRIFEIGSGNSTLMVKNALEENKKNDISYTCRHVCIEPYEQPWLEKSGVEVIRKKVEDIPVQFFQELEAGDILFIDSSHIIRPQGDVLYEYLEILPTLKSGVLIHIHDIFSPKDYLNEWVFDQHKLWNEQYLLEAFMTYNSEFKIVGALNFLSHHYNQEFKDKSPIFAKQENREPGAFWILKK